MNYEFDLKRLRQSRRLCACGCGLPILSNAEGSEFRMGHKQADWSLAMELLNEAGISYCEAWWERKAAEEEAVRADLRLGIWR